MDNYMAFRPNLVAPSQSPSSHVRSFDLFDSEKDHDPPAAAAGPIDGKSSLGLEEWTSPVKHLPTPQTTPSKPGAKLSPVAAMACGPEGDRVSLRQNFITSPDTYKPTSSHLIFENGKRVSIHCSLCQSCDLRCLTCHKTHFSINTNDQHSTMDPPNVCLDCGSKNDTSTSICQICGHTGEGWSSASLHSTIGRLRRQVARCEDDILYLQRQLLDKTAELQRCKMANFTHDVSSAERSRKISGDGDWFQDLVHMVQFDSSSSSKENKKFESNVKSNESARKSSACAAVVPELLEVLDSSPARSANGQILRLANGAFMHF